MQRPQTTERPLWKRAIRVLRLPVYAYLGVVMLMYFLERRLVFFPTATGDWNPVSLDFEDAWFESGDGEKLHGWYHTHPAPRAVGLFMHGNGGNLTYRAEMVKFLRQEMNVSVFIFDYRGYGKSTGSPDEAGILADARAARRWLSQRADVAEGEIVLMGRSLGGGVAVDLAAVDGARGLVLESTFSSLPDVGAYQYRWLPVRLLMQTRLDSISKIGNYQGPLLQSHGTADGHVPYELGKALFDAASSPGKKWVSLPGLDHNDPQPISYYQELDLFLSSLSTDGPAQVVSRE